MKEFWGWWGCKAAPYDTSDDYDWCREMFGYPNANGRWFYEHQTNTFYFKNQQDATWFEIRWR